MDSRKFSRGMLAWLLVIFAGIGTCKLHGFSSSLKDNCLVESIRSFVDLSGLDEYTEVILSGNPKYLPKYTCNIFFLFYIFADFRF